MMRNSIPKWREHNTHNYCTDANRIFFSVINISKYTSWFAH